VRRDTDGPTPLTNSMQILVEWLSDNQNFSRWKGDNIHGSTKGVLYQEISTLNANAGIEVHRSPPSILQKICILESQFRHTFDWLTRTGQGLHDEGVTDERTIVDCVLKRCRYFYELQHVMQGRASTSLIATNHDVDEDSDEDDIAASYSAVSDVDASSE
jgi:hypothetical protein